MSDMPTLELYQRLAVALAIGLLVGLERGWKLREEEEGERTAGLRTYALSGLLGGLSAVTAGPMFLAVAFAVHGAALIIFHHRSTDKNDYSVTSVVAGLLTFALGSYAVMGEIQVAVSAAVAMTLLLALKQPLHSWLRTLTWQEIRAFLILLAMSFLLLPILPNRPVDPWEALNPSEIWIFAILIAAISFIGYVAIRVMGDRAGVALAGLAGGLASSTATTLSFARLARVQPSASSLLAGGTLLASAVMVARILLVASALNPALLWPLIWPLGAAGLVLAACGGILVLWRKGEEVDRPEIAMSSPFELGTALKFAGFIAIITLLAKVVTARFGAAGTYWLAAFSGLADVDAITLSLSRNAEVGLWTAAIGIGIAAAVNTLSKAVMAAVLGPARHGVITGGVSACAIGAGAVALMVSAS